MKKYYRYELELDIKPVKLPEGKRMIRYCESPTFSAFPGCIEAFCEYEVEEYYGPIKHLQGNHHYTRPKYETLVTCREMQLDYCQNLLDRDELYCPHCHKKMEA